MDIVRFQDIGRRGIADEEQLPWATAEGRVVLTHDPDYLALASGGVPHAGIAFCQATKYHGCPSALMAAVAPMADSEGLSNEVKFI